MSYSLNPIEADECLLVTYEGKLTRTEFATARCEAGALLSNKRWNRMVLDFTEWYSRPALLELTSLASDLSAELPSNSRLAFVIRSSQVQQAKIVQRVARSEDVSVAYFFDAEDATAWVKGKSFQQGMKPPPSVNLVKV